MNRINKALVMAFLMIAALSGNAQILREMDQPNAHSYVPKQGFVPDEATAAAVAEAILIPIYGKDAIDRQKPFYVRLSKNIWSIEGKPPEALGGVLLIKIGKKDGRVLQVTHSR